MAYNPPIGRKNTTYIPLIVLAFLGVKNATDLPPLLGEPFQQPLISPGTFEVSVGRTDLGGDFHDFWGPGVGGC